jgi:hypothetical protein
MRRLARLAEKESGKRREANTAFVRNRPSANGYALGEHLDRFCEQEIAKYRDGGLAVPRRCNTCAFRKGTAPNGCVPTVMDARKCALEGVPFLCHEHRRQDEPPLCAGWLLLAKREDEAVAPWPFTKETTG